MTAILAGRSLTRSFGSFRALDAADIELRAGKIHAVMGENGAGKSTLIKVLGGIYQPDAGSLLLDGKPVALPSPKAAARHGIRIVHQERHLIPGLSVAENVLLGDMPVSRVGLLDFAAGNRMAAQLLDDVGIGVEPQRDVATLSAAQQQLVEIARVLRGTSRVLVFDEPTASLTPVEAEQLFGLLRKLAVRDVAILFVSHKIEEVYALCDEVTVLRDGRVVAPTRPLADMPRATLVEAMVGRPVEAQRRQDARRTGGQPVLALEGVSSPVGHRDVDLAIGRGEIHGLYGLVGSGRTELVGVIMGDLPPSAGRIAVAGDEARPRSTSEAVRRFGIGHVSEDRKGEGLAVQQTVRANACAVVWHRLAGRLGGIRRWDEEHAVAEPLRELELASRNLSQAVGTLSGGNQQKVSVAKWLVAGSRLMIFDEPTIGVDVAAKETLHRHIRRLAREGCGILLISSDLAEVIALSDRISIMSGFRIVDCLENSGDYAEMSVRAMRAIQTGAERLRSTSLPESNKEETP